MQLCIGGNKEDKLKRCKRKEQHWDIKGGFENTSKWQGRHINNTQAGVATLGMCGINPSLKKAMPI